MKANTLAENMATESTVEVLEQGNGDDAAVDFWAALSGDPSEIGPADNNDSAVTEFVPQLYRLPSEGDPEMVAEGEPVKVGFGAATPKIPKSTLDETDAFLLDAGWEIFVWIGKDADRSERLAAMGQADKYGNANPRAKSLPVTMIKSGWETSKFNSFFIEE